MRTLGNILWFLFGGLIGGLAWTLAGCIWCITIIGIPFGLQCFKFASLAFFSVWQRCRIWRRQHFLSCQHHLADFLRMGNGVGLSGIGCGLVHYDCWHSGGNAVL